MPGSADFRAGGVAVGAYHLSANGIELRIRGGQAFVETRTPARKKKRPRARGRGRS